MRLFTSVFLVLVILHFPANSANQSPSSEAYVPDEVIVVFRTPTPDGDRAAVAGRMKATVKRRLVHVNAERWKLHDMSVPEAISQLRSDPLVELVEPNLYVRLDQTYPNDERFPELWNFYNPGERSGIPDADVDAPEAWDIATGGEVLVGVVDTGIDFEHEDLAGQIYVNPNEIPDNGLDDDNNGFIDDVSGWDFANDDNVPDDEIGHGTHVSGIIGAKGNNGMGVAGVCWNVKILPLKMFAIDAGTVFDGGEAIDYATTMGARLTNNSWGAAGAGYGFLGKVVKRAHDNGVMTVCSAGNSGVDTFESDRIPMTLDFDNIIAVASTGRSDGLSGFSNYGRYVDVAAPGENVLSTVPDDYYVRLSGTSMSAPHVAGAVALIWSHAPELSYRDVQDLIWAGVDKTPELNALSATGRRVVDSGGRLNIHRSLALLDEARPAPVTDLSATATASDEITLQWTATGDDSIVGTAKRYDIRYHTEPITPENLADATVAMDTPIPQPSGSAESFVIADLEFGTTYHFLLRVIDPAGRPSLLSNVASAATTFGDPPPDGRIEPQAVVKTLFTGSTGERQVSITNDGTGALEWRAVVTDLDFTPGLVAETEGGLAIVANEMAAEAYATAGGSTRVRVHFDTGHGQEPLRWDASFIELEKGIVDVTFGDQALNPGFLADVDILWLTDTYAPQTWTPDEVQAVGDWLWVGGGLLLEGDDELTVDMFNGLLGGLRIPIHYARSPGTPGNSTNVVAHEITEGVQALRFVDNQSFLSRVDWPAQVLLADTLNAPSGAAARWGGGRVLALSDELFESVRGDIEDHYRFMVQAFEWLSRSNAVFATPAAGTLAPGGSEDITVHFDAATLAGGIYEGNVVLSTNDGAQPTSFIHTTLAVTAAPDIELPTSDIDFGVVFTSTVAVDTIRILNSGSADLIIGGISVDNPSFGVDPTTLALAPGERGRLAVTFTPPAPGAAGAKLVLTSNDPDESHIEIGLLAQGEAPPVVAAAPDSISETRFSDEVATRTVTIANSGGYGLDFSVSAELTSSPTDGPALKTMNARAPTSATLDPAELVAADADIILDPDDVTPGAISLVEGVGFSDDFEDGTYAPWVSQGIGIKEVTTIGPADGEYCLHEYDSPFGHDNGSRVDLTPFQPRYIGFYVRYNTTDEAEGYVVLRASLGQLVTYIYGSSSGAILVNSGNPSEFYAGQREAGRWYFFEMKNIDFGTRTFDFWMDFRPVALGLSLAANRYAYQDVARISLYNYGLGTQAWWDEFVLSTDPNAGIQRWLRFDALAGTVAPMDQIDLLVTLRAGQMISGSYRGNIVLTTNDPATPEWKIPFGADITSVPNIAIENTTLDFGRLVLNDSRSIQVPVRNLSLESQLVISDAMVSDPALHVSPDTLVLAPGEVSEITVRYQPIVVDTLNATVTIVSDDRDQPEFPLTAYGYSVYPPMLVVTPDSISVVVESGAMTTADLLLENPAPANSDDLELSGLLPDYYGLRDWASASPRTGTLAGGESMNVTVTFDATGVNAGSYLADLTAYTNRIGARREVVTRLHMQVTGTPVLVASGPIAFGDVFPGDTVSLPLSISNEGTDTLLVSGITSDHDSVTVDPDTLLVPPSQSGEVTVSVRSWMLGPINATLSVQSNDVANPVTPVTVTANIVETPSAGVMPDSIYVRLVEGRSTTRTLNVVNSGGGPLEFGLDALFGRERGVPPGPVPPDWVRPGGASSLLDVLWYGVHDFGTVLWSTVIDDITASGGIVDVEDTVAVSSEMLNAYDVLWLGNIDTPMSADERSIIAGWVLDGGSLLIEADNATAAQSYSVLLADLGAGLAFHTRPPAYGTADEIEPHPVTAGVTSVQLFSAGSEITSTSPGLILVSTSGVPIVAQTTCGQGRVVLMTDNLLTDFIIAQQDNRKLARQVFAWLAGTSWLATSPLVGLVAPAAQEAVELTFSAGEIAVGTYALDLSLSTNDPVVKRLTVPIVLSIVEPAVQSVELAMDEGLNLRSWNVALGETDPAAVLSPVLESILSVQGFDGGGLVFDPTLEPQFNTLTSMDHLHGYWVRLSQPDTLNLEGLEVDHRGPIALDMGFNLVSYLPMSADSTHHAFASAFAGPTVVLGYDGEGLTYDTSIPPAFNTLTIVKPGFGYWVKVGQAGTLTYPDTVVHAPSATLVAAKAERAAETTATTASGLNPTAQWISVWGQDISINGERLATGTVVRALDSDGTVCGEAYAWEGGNFGLMAVYADDPATDVDEGAGTGESLVFVIGDAYTFDGVEWTGAGDVIRFNDVARLSSSSALPLTTALYNNHPNPFNPTTTIRYQLASGGHVSLTVYNVRGQKVRVLVNGTRGPGRYDVVWDGSDDNGEQVASGVYFYRLHAGAVSMTRKMVLLK